MRVSLGWHPTVLYVALSERAWDDLSQHQAEKVRLRWDEFKAWAAGVADAGSAAERDNRRAEGLRYFASRK